MLDFYHIILYCDIEYVYYKDNFCLILTLMFIFFPNFLVYDLVHFFAIIINCIFYLNYFIYFYLNFYFKSL